MSSNPLVSFIIFSYNQEDFIHDAINGALAQTYEPLEIIISDDCSMDNTFEIIKNETNDYNGPHKIILNRNEKNLGLIGHINKVFKMANGNFIVGNAGDDISLPQRTELLTKRWMDNENPVNLVCSFFEEIDVLGNSTGVIKKSVMFSPDQKLPVHKWKCGATGATSGYDRILFDKYGQLDTDIIAEDWIFPFRAWVNSGMAVIEKPLVKHRTHEKSVSYIYKRIKFEKSKEKKYILRLKAAKERKARVLEWYKACMLSGKTFNKKIDEEFKKWTKITEIEVSSFTDDKLRVFLSLIRVLKYPGGIRIAGRIFIRNIIGLM
jgi:glycosyltransferase involved in cell wall biosynthesis